MPLPVLWPCPAQLNLCCGWLFSPLDLLDLLTTPSSQLVCGAAASPPDHPVPETHSARLNCMRASAAALPDSYSGHGTPLPPPWSLAAGQKQTACSAVQHSAAQCRSVPATTEGTETCCSTGTPQKAIKWAYGHESMDCIHLCIGQ